MRERERERISYLGRQGAFRRRAPPQEQVDEDAAWLAEDVNPAFDTQALATADDGGEGLRASVGVVAVGGRQRSKVADARSTATVGNERATRRASSRQDGRRRAVKDSNAPQAPRRDDRLVSSTMCVGAARVLVRICPEQNVAASASNERRWRSLPCSGVSSAGIRHICGRRVRWMSRVQHAARMRGALAARARFQVAETAQGIDAATRARRRRRDRRARYRDSAHITVARCFGFGRHDATRRRPSSTGCVQATAVDVADLSAGSCTRGSAAGEIASGREHGGTFAFRAPRGIRPRVNRPTRRRRVPRVTRSSRPTQGERPGNTRRTLRIFGHQREIVELQPIFCCLRLFRSSIASPPADVHFRAPVEEREVGALRRRRPPRVPGVEHRFVHAPAAALVFERGVVLVSVRGVDVARWRSDVAPAASARALVDQPPRRRISAAVAEDELERAPVRRCARPRAGRHTFDRVRKPYHQSHRRSRKRVRVYQVAEEPTVTRRRAAGAHRLWRRARGRPARFLRARRSAAGTCTVEPRRRRSSDTTTRRVTEHHGNAVRRVRRSLVKTSSA